MKPTIVKLNSLTQFENCNPEIQVPKFPENNFSDVVDPNYIHRKEIAESIGYYLMERISGFTTDGLILEGPTGSGKSSALRQFLAVLNVPVHSETGTSNTEKEVLLGHQDLVEGFLVFKDGPLTTAARQGHAFIFEERDCVPADVNKGLNSVLDGYPIHLADSGDGERVPLAKYFFFAATQNTSAGNDFSGESPAAMMQDSSSEDRFEKIYVPYMEAEHELEVLLKKFNGSVPAEMLSMAIKAANLVRSVYIGVQDEPSSELPTNFQNHQCSLSISTRGLLRFIRKILQFQKLGFVNEDLLVKALWSAFPRGKTTNEDALFVQEIFLSQMAS